MPGEGRIVDCGRRSESVRNAIGQFAMCAGSSFRGDGASTVLAGDGS